MSRLHASRPPRIPPPSRSGRLLKLVSVNFPFSFKRRGKIFWSVNITPPGSQGGTSHLPSKAPRFSHAYFPLVHETNEGNKRRFGNTPQLSEVWIPIGSFPCGINFKERTGTGPALILRSRSGLLHPAQDTYNPRGSLRASRLRDKGNAAGPRLKANGRLLPRTRTFTPTRGNGNRLSTLNLIRKLATSVITMIYPYDFWQPKILNLHNRRIAFCGADW